MPSRTAPSHPLADDASVACRTPGTDAPSIRRVARPGPSAVLSRARLPLGFSAVAALASTLALGGCAALPAARMALPDALAAAVPEPVHGLGAGRSGDWSVGGWRGEFQRGSDRLALFDAVAFDRATTRYALIRPEGGRVQAACRGRQTSVSVGVVDTATRPFTFECAWSGATTASMNVAATPVAAVPRAERRGTFRAGDTVLELQSVHRVQGSPLPLDAPIGYLVSHGGRPVGAIELNGTSPRLWRPTAGTPLHEPVTLAALALALLWDPAAAAP